MNDFFDKHIASHLSSESDQTVKEISINRESESDLQDIAHTPSAIKSAIQELLKYGLLEAERKPNLYQSVTTNTSHVNRILEPLDLQIQIDEIRGLAFIKVSDGFSNIDAYSMEDANLVNDDSNSDWSHPLVRRQRLTLEQSLMVAILRQLFLAHEQEAGLGAGNAVVAIEELMAHTEIYFARSGSETRDQKRILNLLENLRTHGIVSEVDKYDKISIRPIITHLANPESLESLLTHFTALANK